MENGINVLSLFDGISGGQMALDKLGIKINNYYASEIDKYAIQACMNNYPDTIQIGDVRNVNGYDYKDIDLICAGSPCFVAGTPVITESAIKSIENVEVGDMVLTHKNRFRKVLKTGGEKYKQIVDVKVQGVSLIETTSEHPFYVRENFDYVPIWKKAIELVSTDYVGMFISDKIVWLSVISSLLTDKYKEVFNIEVEEDNSYTANGIIVHNCQSFSFSGKMKGMSTKDNIEIITLEQYLDLKEKGYEFEGQSYLFWEFVRILKEVKPKYFLLENVMMKEHWEKVISETLGVEPLKDKNGKKGLNSNLVSAQNRKRLYWTNIPNITPPEDKGITWGDIREHGVNSESYYYTDKAMQWLARHSQRKNKNLTVHLDNEKVQMIEASHGKKYSSQRFFGVCDLPSNNQTVEGMRGKYNMFNKIEQQIEFRLDKKTNTITTVAKDNVIVPFTLPNRIPVDEFFFRYITPLECVRAQTIPDNYFIDDDGNQIISNSQIYRSVGNGWTIDMIVHIFSFMIKNKDNI